MDVADTGDTIHVAAGTYYERITLKDGVQVLGAGAGVTTIDGSGSGPVVTAIFVGSGTKLDGFTITNGSGGGMYNYYSSLSVTNCTFSRNRTGGWGGGMLNYVSSSTVTNCIFSGNSAYHGGGMLNYYCSPSVTNCAFSGNSAYHGGGMLNYYCSPSVTNCAFSGNSAYQGGGMCNHWYSSPIVTNCIFSGNSASYGGGMCNFDSSSPIVTNCILWGNGGEISNLSSTPVFTYCDIQGGYSGVGNINADPLFVDPAAGDYHLKPGSACIDTGSDAAPCLPSTDFEGDPRILDGNGDGVAVVDMGADEYCMLALPATVDIDPDTLNLKSKVKWITVYIELPEGYDVTDIDISTVEISDVNGDAVSIPAESHPTEVDDYDNDGVPDLMVKFDRSEVQDNVSPGDATITVKGKLTDGTLFEGTDTIRVINKGNSKK